MTDLHIFDGSDPSEPDCKVIVRNPDGYPEHCVPASIRAGVSFANQTSVLLEIRQPNFDIQYIALLIPDKALALSRLLAIAANEIVNSQLEP